VEAKHRTKEKTVKPNKSLSILGVPVALLACAIATSNVVTAASNGTSRIAVPAQAAQAGAHVVARAGVPDDSDFHWHGEPLSTLAERHWQWLGSIPRQAAQLDDTEGKNCGINQQGPVWFLHSHNFIQPIQTCTVPAGKPIFGPVLGLINDYPCPDPNFEPAPGQSLKAFLQDLAAYLIDTGVTRTEAFIDGVPLKVRRVRTGIFGFTAAKDLVSVDSCFTGSPQLATTDGYYLLLDPLPRGNHVLRVRAWTIQPGFEFLETTYMLKVR
jgi:hypothetical protein